MILTSSVGHRHVGYSALVVPTVRYLPRANEHRSDFTLAVTTKSVFEMTRITHRLLCPKIPGKCQWNLFMYRYRELIVNVTMSFDSYWARLVLSSSSRNASIPVKIRIKKFSLCPAHVIGSVGSLSFAR